MAVTRKRPTGPEKGSSGTVQPDGFPTAPPFDPAAWLGDTLHERALDYARTHAADVGHAYPGPLAWGAFTAAQRAARRHAGTAT